MNVIYILVPRCITGPHLIHSFFRGLENGGGGLAGGWGRCVGAGSLKRKGSRRELRLPTAVAEEHQYLLG